MVNSEILINYYSVYNDTPKEVEKEVALNLLERMLTLYIRVRAFLYAKKKVELHKIQINILKSHSIRTEMKKSYMDRIDKSMWTEMKKSYMDRIDKSM